MLIDKWMGTCALLIATTAAAAAAIDAPAAQDKSAKQTITGCLQGPLPIDEYSVSLRPDAATNTSGTSVYRVTNVMTKDVPATTSIYVLVARRHTVAESAGESAGAVPEPA
jgi:hypothetical protein